MKNKLITAVLFLFLMKYTAYSQIPVEVIAGNKKATFDMMFFKFFKNTKEENTKFLFFSRARSSVDYKMTTSTYLPSFGLIEAVSYNHKKLKGFAPVAVVQILNRGVYTKAGMQYAHLKKNFTFFSWVVCETASNPDVDYFLLVRYTPGISEKMNFYSQFESSNSFPTHSYENFNFTQRIRLGLMLKNHQFGVAADINNFGRTNFINTYNFGGFLRHEF